MPVLELPAAGRGCPESDAPAWARLFAWMHFPNDPEQRCALEVALTVRHLAELEGRLADPDYAATYDAGFDYAHREALLMHLEDLGGSQAIAKAFRCPLALRVAEAPFNLNNKQDQ